MFKFVGAARHTPLGDEKIEGCGMDMSAGMPSEKVKRRAWRENGDR